MAHGPHHTDTHACTHAHGQAAYESVGLTQRHVHSLPVARRYQFAVIFINYHHTLFSPPTFSSKSQFDAIRLGISIFFLGLVLIVHL